MMVWRIARLLPQAGLPLVAVTAVTNLVLGVLPIVFIVATSLMLGRVPDWPSALQAFGLAAVAFAAQQALAPLQVSLGELVAREIDGRVFDRLMAASLASPGIAALEDQHLLDELSTASHELESGFQSPGRAGAGLLTLLARGTQLAGFVIIVGVAWSWLAAALLAAVTLMFRYGQFGGIGRYARSFVALASLRRYNRYLRDLAMRAGAAKEIRVFGLLTWLARAYRMSYLAWLMPLWASRRRIMLKPYFWYVGVAVPALALILGSVGAAGADGLPLVQLALVLQASLGALQLGEYFPESDTQVQFGLVGADAVARYEAGVAAAGFRPRGTAARRGRVAVPAVLEQGIRFEGVTFGYPGQTRPVFESLDLTIRAGQCTAIVGVNGAGKTTLVKLLARLYEPERGIVSADGLDVAGFPVDAWRSRLGVIFQDFNKYEVSAAENIAFGAPEHLADRERIRAAAHAAGILATLERLPHGLDTVLARHLGGAELSGGQWQRVALARALFAVDCGASVLVLDEPTANLDVRAEARFFDEFVGLTRGVTTVLISHRFSTVRHADHIVVLEQGRVYEQGTHDQLLEHQGRYATLFELQAQRFTGRVDDQVAV